MTLARNVYNQRKENYKTEEEIEDSIQWLSNAKKMES